MLRRLLSSIAILLIFSFVFESGFKYPQGFSFSSCGPSSFLEQALAIPTLCVKNLKSLHAIRNLQTYFSEEGKDAVFKKSWEETELYFAAPARALWECLDLEQAKSRRHLIAKEYQEKVAWRFTWDHVKSGKIKTGISHAIRDITIEDLIRWGTVFYRSGSICGACFAILFKNPFVYYRPQWMPIQFKIAFALAFRYHVWVNTLAWFKGEPLRVVPLCDNPEYSVEWRAGAAPYPECPDSNLYQTLWLRLSDLSKLIPSFGFQVKIIPVGPQTPNKMLVVFDKAQTNQGLFTVEMEIEELGSLFLKDTVNYLRTIWPNDEERRQHRSDFMVCLFQFLADRGFNTLRINAVRDNTSGAVEHLQRLGFKSVTDGRSMAVDLTIYRTKPILTSDPAIDVALTRIEKGIDRQLYYDPLVFQTWVFIEELNLLQASGILHRVFDMLTGAQLFASLYVSHLWTSDMRLTKTEAWEFFLYFYRQVLKFDRYFGEEPYLLPLNDSVQLHHTKSNILTNDFISQWTSEMKSGDVVFFHLTMEYLLWHSTEPASILRWLEKFIKALPLGVYLVIWEFSPLEQKIQETFPNGIAAHFLKNEMLEDAADFLFGSHRWRFDQINANPGLTQLASSRRNFFNLTNPTISPDLPVTAHMGGKMSILIKVAA